MKENSSEFHNFSLEEREKDENEIQNELQTKEVTYCLPEDENVSEGNKYPKKPKNVLKKSDNLSQPSTSRKVPFYNAHKSNDKRTEFIASKSKKLKKFLSHTLFQHESLESDLDLHSSSSYIFSTCKSLSEGYLSKKKLENAIRSSSSIDNYKNDIVKEIIPLNQFPGISIFQIVTNELLTKNNQRLELIIVLPKPFSSDEIENIRKYYSQTKNTSLVYCGLCNKSFCQTLDQFDATEEEIEVDKYVWGLCLQRVMKHHIQNDKLKHIINKDVFCPQCEYKKVSLSAMNYKKLYNNKKLSSYKKPLFKSLFKEKSKTVSCMTCRSYLCEMSPLVKRLLTKAKLDEKYKSYKCEICKKIINYNKRQAIQHIIEHIRTGNILCSECYSSTSRKSSLIANTNALEAPITCGACKKSYPNVKAFLGKWIDIVTKTAYLNKKRKKYYIYQCNICQKKIRYAARMEVHMVSHVIQNLVFCSKCRKNENVI